MNTKINNEIIEQNTNTTVKTECEEYLYLNKIKKESKQTITSKIISDGLNFLTISIFFWLAVLISWMITDVLTPNDFSSYTSTFIFEKILPVYSVVSIAFIIIKIIAIIYKIIKYNNIYKLTKRFQEKLTNKEIETLIDNEEPIRFEKLMRIADVIYKCRSYYFNTDEINQFRDYFTQYHPQSVSDITYIEQLASKLLYDSYHKTDKDENKNKTKDKSNDVVEWVSVHPGWENIYACPHCSEELDIEEDYHEDICPHCHNFISWNNIDPQQPINKIIRDE